MVTSMSDMVIAGFLRPPAGQGSDAENRYDHDKYYDLFG
jgi:hypothetical protein